MGKARSVFTIAHELGHHFLTPNDTSIDFINLKNNSIKEKMVDAFAQEFLVPSLSLYNYFKNEGLLNITLNKSHIVDLCQHFNVNYFMMLVVLKDNGYIKNNDFDRLKKYTTNELKNFGYCPDKYTANHINLKTLLEKTVAKGLRKEKFNILYASEILNVTESEVKDLI